MKFKDRLAKLIDVKTLVTISMTGLFIAMCFECDVEPEKVFDKVCDILMMILCFYFGTQHEKANNRKE
jgi:hypothetical protein